MPLVEGCWRLVRRVALVAVLCGLVLTACGTGNAHTRGVNARELLRVGASLADPSISPRQRAELLAEARKAGANREVLSMLASLQQPKLRIPRAGLQYRGCPTGAIPGRYIITLTGCVKYISPTRPKPGYEYVQWDYSEPARITIRAAADAAGRRAQPLARG